MSAIEQPNQYEKRGFSVIQLETRKLIGGLEGIQNSACNIKILYQGSSSTHKICTKIAFLPSHFKFD